ncbi:uncharacterized protein Tco_1290005, partial [Tanacetum coccineum]
WIRDDTKPYYPPESCPYIDAVFNCHRYQRPDIDFVKWRWQPFGCDMPSLNATDFLERIKGKKMVFVGDSLNRNMWESLVCILRHSLEGKNMVFEISGRKNFHKRGYYAFKEFEKKGLRKTKCCLGLQIQHLDDGALVHQKHTWKRFNMDKSHSLSTPIAVRSLDVEINPFRPPKDDEDILGPEFIMSNNIAKLAFLALDITGKNYLSWVLDAEIHLDANGIGNTIKEGNETSVQDKAKSMIFLCHHLDEALKTEYLTVKDPLVLWKNLKDRYDHQKTVILPRTRYEWVYLRLQDFKSVGEYNSAVFRITSQLSLCGEKITDEEMLEKTFSTFHASNMLLQQQYRERGFKKYCDLISCLLVAEQNNELLMKNHETRPTGTAPFPEANVATLNNQNRGRGRGRGFDHGCGSRRGRGRSFGRGVYQDVQFKNTSGHNKWQDKGKVNEKGQKARSTTTSTCL